MDSCNLLRHIVACGAVLVALACVAGAVYLEVNGKPTPQILGVLGGSAVGQLASVVGPMQQKQPETK